jgi:dolichyl-phosphate beta-glucosyltransferase
LRSSPFSESSAEVPAPRLSLVVPAFNEEKRIATSLTTIGAFLAGLDFSSEVIVVDDGSGPAGLTAEQEALAALPVSIERNQVCHEVNRGKGAAVRTGSLAARGDFIGFIDADLATPPQDILPLLVALQEGADVAIGVRNQADGSDMRSRRSLPRRLAGAAFSLLQRTILLPDVADSQCPLKVFRRDPARRLFQLQKIDTWSFDAELLYLAHRLGLSVAKVPVHWQAVEGSHLRLNLRSAVEVLNLFRIRFAHRHVTPATLRFDAAEAGSAETSP